MSKAVVEFTNHYKSWTPKDQAILIRTVLRNARNNVPMEETWTELSELFKRKPSSCEVAWNRFAPERKKTLAAYHYELHANGTYSSEPVSQVEVSEAPVAPASEGSIEDSKEILESIQQTASLLLPAVSEANVEVTPLVKALAFIVTQVGALESQVTKYKALARTRKEEIEKLHTEKDELREELRLTRNRLAQVVKK